MNDLCVEIGYKSVNHIGEQLCGDHVDVVESGEDSSVIVLADGLGSGVKASILSTLTSKIISTMMAEGLSVEDCVETIAATLPICSVRGVAYSTFTIIHVKNNEEADIVDEQIDAAVGQSIRQTQALAFAGQVGGENFTLGGQAVGKRHFRCHERRLPARRHRFVV